MVNKTGPSADSCYYMPGHHDRDWMTRAACRGQDPELWFPIQRDDRLRSYYDRQARETIARVKEICYECPVAIICRSYAIETDSRHGIWGGTTEAERTKLTGRRAYG